MKGNLLFVRFSDKGTVWLQFNGDYVNRPLNGLTPKEFLCKLKTKLGDVVVVDDYSDESTSWSLATGAVVLVPSPVLQRYTTLYYHTLAARKLFPDNGILIRQCCNELRDYQLTLEDEELYYAIAFYNTVACDSRYEMLPTSDGKVTLFDL